MAGGGPHDLDLAAGTHYEVGERWTSRVPTPAPSLPPPRPRYLHTGIDRGTPLAADPVPRRLHPPGVWTSDRLSCSPPRATVPRPTSDSSSLPRCTTTQVDLMTRYQEHWIKQASAQSRWRYLVTTDPTQPSALLIGAQQAMSSEQYEDGVNALKRIYDLLTINRSYTGPLWHYTTAAGARDILKSSTIWASDADYLNDPGELRVMARAIAAQTRNRLAQRPTLTNAAIHALANIKVNQTMDTAYVASFSSLEDDLSQWRSYADDGAGCAIEFDSSAFDLGETLASTSLSKCIYPSEDDLTLSVVAILDGGDRYAEEVGKSGNSSRATWAREVFLQLSQISLSPLIKSPGYRGEEEVRLVRLGQTRQFASNDTPHIEDRRSRLRGSMFVPYVSVDVSRAIKSIMIGPKSSSESGPRYQYGLMAYLDSINRNDLPIALSKHAYR